MINTNIIISAHHPPSAPVWLTIPVWFIELPRARRTHSPNYLCVTDNYHRKMEHVDPTHSPVVNFFIWSSKSTLHSADRFPIPDTLEHIPDINPPSILCSFHDHSLYLNGWKHSIIVSDNCLSFECLKKRRENVPWTRVGKWHPTYYAHFSYY